MTSIRILIGLLLLVVELAGQRCLGAQENTEKPMHTNQLVNETSPYLLQHAHNPVNWYPWGKEAFEKAKRENKPIFLSVGYSTCYWCHVMEVQSFEDEEVAAVLNKHFIAIKVDREERPDIDEQYMLATQLMTGRGGWPNSVWLTQDGKPWMAGTYFPKERFIAVLEQIHSFWIDRRDDVDRQAQSLADAAKRMSAPPTLDQPDLSQSLVDNAVKTFIEQFDANNGGFGGAPKFPPHGTLALLIDQYRQTQNKQLLRVITKTLDAMWMGGIHDHLGGGFHRYATDSIWLLPHFEKMLYDNAQLMTLYAEGYEITGEIRYKEAVADIHRWLEREMTSKQGAFFSALDSGEVGKEGEAYVWTMKQLRGVLDTEDAALFAKIYGFEPEGNFEEESTGEKTGHNIPHLDRSLDELPDRYSTDKKTFDKRLADIRNRLLAERLTWPQPHRDDKVLTSWNGLMISALANAGRILDEPKYIGSATRAAEFILTRMVRNGKLLRTYRSDQAKLNGYLDDYTYFLLGLLQLHAATDEARWLREAEKHADVLLAEFEDKQNGGFFFTGTSHEQLMVRSKNLSGGGNMPSTNGVATQVLIRLYELTGEERYLDSAKRTLESFAGVMAAQPHTSEHLLIGVSRYMEATETANQREDAPGEKRDAPISVFAHLSQQSLSSDKTTELVVEIAIDDGWHLYAPNDDVDFVRPTEITVHSQTPLNFKPAKRPESESHLDPVFNKAIQTYHGKIKFVYQVAAKTPTTSGTGMIEISVNWQACDEKRCLQPKETSLTIPFTIK